MSTTPKELKDFFKSLEEVSTLNIWKIQQDLDSCGKIPEEWNNKITAERKVLFCSLNNGELIEHFSTTDLQGKNRSGLMFNKTELDYINKRLNKTKNTWLKARYSNVLWIHLKHNKFAEIAIENYLRCFIDVDPGELQNLTSLLDACLYLSKKTSLYLEEVKEFVSAMFSNVPAWYKAHLIESIIKNQIFSNSELKVLAEDSINWIDKDNSYSSNKHILECSIQLRNKVQLSTKICNELLSDNEELILRQHTDDDNFVKYSTIANQIQYLKKADNPEKLRNAELEYKRLKQLVDLRTVSIEFDGPELDLLNEYLEKKTDAILSLSTESILAYFAVNDDIIVDYESIKESSLKSIKSSISQLFAISVLDINTNIKTLTDKEKVEFEIIRQYSIAHNIKFYIVFTKVFANAMLRGKLNYYKVYTFLKEHSWYSSKTKKKMLNNELDKNSDWLSLLAPGLHNLFAQFEQSILNKNNKIYNYILAIDSLTIKFEGALRDFICLTGGTTTVSKKEGLQEALLEELLKNEKVKQHFSSNDIELFRYTFTKHGLNVRNNVAHGFMEYSDYNHQVASLVFFCILRLGKFSIVK